jgi:hypothetical protein
METQPVFVANSSHPKPVSAWTPLDFTGGRYYQFPEVKLNDFLFFGNIPTPPLSLSSDFLTCLHPEDSLHGDKEVYELLQYLDATMTRTAGEESAVIDFVVALLRVLDFAPKGTMIRTRKKFPLLSHDGAQHATADVCILEGTDPLLIIQEDKSHLDPFYDAFIQLMATATAAYSADALNRDKYGLPSRRNTDVLGIVMIGSWPTFYKITGLGELVNMVKDPCLIRGKYISIHSYHPNVPRPLQREREGMKPLDNREIIISSFMQFKQLVFENTGKGMHHLSKLRKIH